MIGRFHKQRALQVSKYSKGDLRRECFTREGEQGKVEREGSRQRKRRKSKQKKNKQQEK